MKPDAFAKMSAEFDRIARGFAESTKAFERLGEEMARAFDGLAARPPVRDPFAPPVRRIYVRD